MQDHRIVTAMGGGEPAVEAVKIFISTARESVDRKGCFTVALSGGNTPRKMHRMLAAQPYAAEVDWAYTHIFWVDERCVPRDDPDSNFGAAWKDFLSRVPIPGENLHAVKGELPPGKGAGDYEADLADFFGLGEGDFPVFDLIFLGMGGDGHTASLFPGDPALLETRRRVVAVRGGVPEVDRVTMTLPVLNGAKRIVFLVTGREKARTVRAVLCGESRLLPAARIQPRNGDLLWILDGEAAIGIERMDEAFEGEEQLGMSQDHATIDG